MENILYFFRATEEYPNFITFGKEHLLLLVIAIVGSLFILTRKKECRRIELILGIGMIVQQTILYCWYFITKYHLLSEGLPLYHCRIAIITMGLGLTFKYKPLQKIGSYWGIFGSISALIFVGLDNFYFPHITQFSYFIGHFLLLWGAIYLLNIKKVGMSKKDYQNTLIFTNIYHIIMFFVNKIVHGNYAYMASSPIPIGDSLSPVAYGLCVMMIFNIILTIEYIYCNRATISEEIEEYEEYKIEEVSIPAH